MIDSQHASEAVRALSTLLLGLDPEGDQRFELSHSLIIICPDCGKNVAFRGRCPKCGGDSWVPAGHGGGIYELMRNRLTSVVGEGTGERV